jgi:hypothetical protein
MYIYSIAISNHWSSFKFAASNHALFFGLDTKEAKSQGCG